MPKSETINNTDPTQPLLTNTLDDDRGLINRLIDKIKHLLQSKIWQESFVQGATVSFNASTIATYLASILYYLQHLSESAELPDYLRELLKKFDRNILDLDQDWEIIFLALISTGSLALLISNQDSMPDRIRKMFGWPVAEQSTQPHRYRKAAMTTASIVGSVYKAVVSSTSLQAGLGPYLGFWASVGIAAVTFPGNVAAQFANLSGYSGNSALPEPLRKFNVSYLTFSYGACTTILLANAMDASLQRAGWYDKRLLQIDSLPVSIVVNAVHLSFVANLLFITYINYYKSINRLFKRANKENAYLPIASTNDADATFDITTASTLTDLQQNKASFWSTTNKLGMAATAYKSLAMFFALLGIIALTEKIDEFDSTTFLIIAAALLVSVPNFVAQATYFTSAEEPKLTVAKPESSSRLMQGLGFLKSCCTRQGSTRDIEYAVENTTPSIP